MNQTMINKNKGRLTAGILMIILAFTMITSPALTEGGIIDVPQDVYDQMLEHFEYQEFAEVEALCKQLGTYLDSKSYLRYAEARIFIEQAEYSEAAAIFSALSITEFHDSAAWNAYAMGMVNYENRDFAAAIPFFEDAHNISDSLDKLIECRIACENMFLSDAFCVSADAESMLIEWSDVGEGHKYIVRYTPRYVVKNSHEIMVNEQFAELTDLIPNTEYNIFITIEGMPHQAIEFTAQTKKLESDISMFSLRSISLYSYNRNDEKRYGLDKLIENSISLMTKITDNTISLPDAPPAFLYDGYIIVALLSVNSKDAPEIINARLVLRLNKYGTYEVRAGTSFVLKETRYPFVKLQLNDVLDDIYSQQDTWPQVAGSYELYINNSYIGGGDLTLSNQK